MSFSRKQWGLRQILFFHISVVGFIMAVVMVVANALSMERFMQRSAADDLFPILKSINETIDATVDQKESELRQFETYSDLRAMVQELDRSRLLTASNSATKTKVLIDALTLLDKSDIMATGSIVMRLEIITRDGVDITKSGVNLIPTEEIKRIEAMPFSDGRYLDDLEYVEPDQYVSHAYLTIQNEKSETIGWMKVKVSLTELLRQSVASYSFHDKGGTNVPPPPSVMYLSFLSESGSQLYTSDTHSVPDSIVRQIETRYENGNKMGFFVNYGVRRGMENTLVVYSDGYNKKIDLKWIVLLNQPLGMALKQIGTIVLGNALIIGLGIAVIACVSGLIMDLFVGKPLRNLTAMAKQIANGDLDVHMKQQRTVEMSELATQFDQMALQLATRQHNIISLNSQLKVLNATLRHDILNRLVYIGGSIKNYVDFGTETVSDSLRALFNEITSVVKSSVEFIEEMKEVEEDMAPSCPVTRYRLGPIIQKAARQLVMEVSVNGEATVIADQVVESVISNILLNAKIHGRVNKVAIQIEPRGNLVEVRIADLGKGIPDEIKPKLFIQGNAFGPTGHTGMGLYVAKMTMERYGGNIRVEDNVPHGAVFVLTFRKG